ncbi:MAG: hypothetical protein ACPLN0_04885 [Candidatus Hydrothermia bacterium]
MDFDTWLLYIKADERKYRLYEIHKKSFVRSRFAIIIDMLAIILLSVLVLRMAGITFTRGTFQIKNFLLLGGLMVLIYILWVSIPIYLFSKTPGLFLMGLRAISSKTLKTPTLLETYYYIGQDKRYSSQYPIYIFLVPDSEFPS